MPHTVDFNTISTVGLESSPVAATLAGLRANEARYFKNKYDHVFTVEPAAGELGSPPARQIGDQHAMALGQDLGHRPELLAVVPGAEGMHQDDRR